MRRSLFLILAGLLLLGVAAGAVGYPLWWQHRSHSAGQTLLRRVSVPVEGTAACRPPARVRGGAEGVLVIPSIGVTAPVVAGVSDASLAEAVGHDSASPWPGDLGESVLLAHDVSYFTHLDQLRPGATVIWASGCTRWTFEETGRQIDVPGTLLPAPRSGHGLALVTCWPTDALWWTDQRLVVETRLVSRTTLAAPVRSRSATPSVALVVPAPKALRSRGLSLDDNPVVLGTLTLTGDPSPAFRVGPAPLEAARAGLEAYIAARLTVGAGDRAWWSHLALPGVPLPGQWSEAGILNTVVQVSGERVVRIVLESDGARVVLLPRGHDLLVAAVDS